MIFASLQLSGMPKSSKRSQMLQESTRPFHLNQLKDTGLATTLKLNSRAMSQVIHGGSKTICFSLLQDGLGQTPFHTQTAKAPNAKASLSERKI